MYSIYIYWYTYIWIVNMYIWDLRHGTKFSQNLGTSHKTWLKTKLIFLITFLFKNAFSRSSQRVPLQVGCHPKIVCTCHPQFKKKKHPHTWISIEIHVYVSFRLKKESIEIPTYPLDFKEKSIESHLLSIEILAYPYRLKTTKQWKIIWFQVKFLLKISCTPMWFYCSLFGGDNLLMDPDLSGGRGLLIRTWH